MIRRGERATQLPRGAVEGEGSRNGRPLSTTTLDNKELEIAVVLEDAVPFEKSESSNTPRVERP